MQTNQRKQSLLTAERLSHVEQFMREQVSTGQIAGAVTLVAQGGEIVQLLPVGRMDIETDCPMESDTIFRIYSLTKIVASVAVMQLYEAGHFELHEPISSFIPAFRDVKVFVEKTPTGLKVEPSKREITIHDLLTHTAGIGMDALFRSPLGSAYRNAKLAAPDQTLEDMVSKLAELPLLHHPGEAWQYSVSPDVLARLVEVVSGKGFDEYLSQHILEPLGMVDTGFFVPDEKLHRLATVYGTERGALRVVDSAVSSPYAKRQSFHSGSAGLVSTPIDYFHFAQMLLNKGAWQGARILRPETVELMTQNHLPADVMPYQLPWKNLSHYTRGCGFGLGVRVVLDVPTWGVPGSVGEYGWAGATNTFLWVDPKQETVLLLFMQSIPFMHLPIDQQFKTLVYEALDY